MALDAASKEILKKLGIDPAKLADIIAAPTEMPLTMKGVVDGKEADVPFSLTPSTIRNNTPSGHYFYNEEELNGLKGRVGDDKLKQAEELGIKALKEKAGLTFEGKDPGKFLEELGKHLKVPVDAKLTEKERDIQTLREAVLAEKTKYTELETKWKDREELDAFSKLLPANKTKILRDNEIRARLMEEGYKLGEHEGKPALFKNGEPYKDAEAKLVDPKAFIPEWMKTNGLIEVEQAADTKRKTFDTKTRTGQDDNKFDHATAYEAALAAGGGKWNEVAQARYTEAMAAAK